MKKRVNGIAVECDIFDGKTDVYLADQYTEKLLSVVTVNGVARVEPGKVVTARGNETIVPGFEQYTYIDCDPCDIQVK